MKHLKSLIGLFAVLLTLNTMASFEKAHPITKAFEGGYVDVPSDRGGETVDGISRNYHPTAKVWKYVDMAKRTVGIDSNKINTYLKSIPQFAAARDEFYKANFWDVNNLDLIDSQLVANELYDTGVNQGTKSAAKYLQYSLNFLNQNQRIYPDIKVDGDVGPTTIRTVASCLKYYERYGREFSESTLTKAINGEQYLRYRTIVLMDPSQEVNFAGWLRRV